MTTGDTASLARVESLDGLLDGVSGERLAATVAALAGDGCAGRRVGSAGGGAARAWLRQHLADLGTAVSFESFPVRSVPEVYTTPAVQWHDGDRTRRLVFGREVAVHLASADAPLSRPGGLAMAGQGDPVGRWLVVPAGMSRSNASGHAHDAAGLLLGRGVDGDGWQYTILAGPNPGPLPILTLDTDTHAAVMHATTADGTWLAGNAPIRRLDVTGTNLHGRWPAAAAGVVEILLTAHYDGVGDNPGLRQPAAADNASGVAVVLEAARLLASARPEGVGPAVALLDGEETGALGSAHHARPTPRRGRGCAGGQRRRRRAPAPSCRRRGGWPRAPAARGAGSGRPAHRPASRRGAGGFGQPPLRRRRPAGGRDRRRDGRLPQPAPTPPTESRRTP